MKAEIIDVEDGGRVIVGKINPIGEREFCLEIHRGSRDEYKVMHTLLTRQELAYLMSSISVLLEAKIAR